MKSRKAKARSNRKLKKPKMTIIKKVIQISDHIS